MIRLPIVISLVLGLSATAVAQSESVEPETTETKTFNSATESAELRQKSLTGPQSSLLGARHRLDAGVFLGANYLANELELGNSYLDDQVPQSAFLLGLRATYLLIPHLMPSMSLDPSLSVEVEAKLALSSTAGNADFMRDSYSAPVLGWRAQAVLSVWNDRQISPFAVLGLGGETAFSSSPFVRSVDTDAQLHWGLGARYEMKPEYGLRADFRHGITAGRYALAANTVEFHVGFFYRFGFGGARAPAKVEPEPDPAVKVEPLDEPEPKQPVDSDGDGILDDKDQCPKEPETVNEIDDEDGCPESDRDGDKVLDANDKCPDEAEDIDEF